MRKMKKRVSNYWLEETKRNFMEFTSIQKKLVTEETCLSALRKKYPVLQFIPEAQKTFPNENLHALCLAMVKEDGYALKYVPEALKTKAVCLAAVQQYGWALEYVPRSRKTVALCLTAALQNRRALKLRERAIRVQEARERALDEVEDDWDCCWISMC